MRRRVGGQELPNMPPMSTLPMNPPGSGGGGASRVTGSPSPRLNASIGAVSGVMVRKVSESLQPAATR